MIFIYCAQGTPEWHAARCGVITASRFKDACERLKPKKDQLVGECSKEMIKYACQVAIERIAGSSVDEVYQTWQMSRGHDLETPARMEYESVTGNLASEAGIVLTEDSLFGYSTDGFVDKNGMIEIKCPASSEKIVSMWKTGDVSEYIHQIQGGMWITGREWCDFIMYAPQLQSVGKQLYLKRICRDEDFISRLEAQLVEFAGMVEENEAILRKVSE